MGPDPSVQLRDGYTVTHWEFFVTVFLGILAVFYVACVIAAVCSMIPCRHRKVMVTQHADGWRRETCRKCLNYRYTSPTTVGE